MPLQEENRRDDTAEEMRLTDVVLLKAESVADKVGWLEKLRNVVESKGAQLKGQSAPPMRSW
ncbi:hypothetical protein COLO4_33452 [Corchorus olitorius]|uniref:PH domain-containing protein n=1 Tax=Corchorus olitorius TaxID=93759 RepID=A0A1R3GTM4_9ROSI|nr:hypothetical protein COLO4_33452 [Corchorus olitorius]